MSLRRQSETRGPSFTGAGNRPFLIPSYQVAREIGIIFRTSGKRKKAAVVVITHFHPQLGCPENVSSKIEYASIDRRGGPSISGNVK